MVNNELGLIGTVLVVRVHLGARIMDTIPVNFDKPTVIQELVVFCGGYLLEYLTVISLVGNG